MNSGLYKITNTINGNFYIGSTSNFNRRWYRHVLDLNKNRHDNQHLQRSWNKYGKDNFIFEIYKNCDSSILLKEEQQELDMWVGNKQCYNIRQDAVCPVSIGEHRNEEIKRKEGFIRLKRLNGLKTDQNRVILE
jgi:group I intron endonuclease